MPSPAIVTFRPPAKRFRIRRSGLVNNGKSMRLRELEQMLRRAARRTGTRPYLVGGAVRDSLLRRKISDVDLALASGEKRLALDLAREGLGTAFALSPPDSPFPVWRVARAGLTIDIARFERDGSIESDLSRRDFTVNAIAREIGTEKRIDPFGGAADLKRGLVRAISEANLGEDPLRVLRAYRLAGTRNWRIERRTRRWLVHAAAGLRRVAAERVHDELVRLFTAPATDAIRWALEDAVLEETLGLGDTPALRRAIRHFPRARRGDPRGSVLSGRLAILYHRASVGAAAAGDRLQRAKFTRAEAREIASRLRFLGEAFSSADVLPVLFAAREDRAALVRLARDAAQNRRERARASLLAAALRRAATGEAPVRGDDVREWLGLPPGPTLGRYLSEAQFRWFTGEWRSRDEILRGLRTRHAIDRAATVR